MNVSVEAISTLGRRLKIAVPSTTIAAKKQTKLQHFAANMKINGFRKGKVPANFIQQKYGAQLHNEVIDEVIRSSLEDALKKENLSPADTPTIEKINAEQGQDLEYEVKFEVFPQIELLELTKVELEKPVAEITPEDIDKGISSLQEQFADWLIVDRAAVDGDQLKIDFVGSIDGVEFNNGAGKNVSLEIGSGRFIPGFEENLIGASAGDSKTIDVTFPSNYGAADLAGKAAQFAVTVHSVATKQIAAIDEEFAKKIGIEDGDVGKVRDKIKDNMTIFLANLAQEELRNQAVDKLLELHEFSVPAHFLALEKERIIAADQKNEISRTPEQLEEEALKQLRLAFILQKVIESNNIKPDQARIRAKLSEISAMLGGNVEQVQRLYNNSKELLANLKNAALMDQAIDHVIEYATIKEKVSNFYDIANRSA